MSYHVFSQSHKQRLVYCKSLICSLFQGLINCIGVQVLSKILERLVKNYRAVCSGFPDLLVWNPYSSKVRWHENLDIKQLLHCALCHIFFAFALWLFILCMCNWFPCHTSLVYFVLYLSFTRPYIGAFILWIKAHTTVISPFVSFFYKLQNSNAFVAQNIFGFVSVIREKVNFMCDFIIFN